MATTQAASRPSPWRLAAALGAVAVLIALARWAPADGQQAPSAAPQAPVLGSVTVEAVRPGAPAATLSVPWREGLTVEGATRAAAAAEPAAWATLWRGEGESALLESLGGVASGEGGLYWQFAVNGDYGSRGAGATPLRPGDRVLWKLAEYE